MKLGIIHTTHETFHSLEKLAKERIPDLEVINVPDETVLKNTLRGEPTVVGHDDWVSYAKELEKQGVDVILIASALVSEYLDDIKEQVQVPVYRIDGAMAERAVEIGGSIIVFGTLESSMNPTVDLIKKKASEAGKDVQVETVIIEGAHEALQDSNKRLHDRLIIDVVDTYGQQSDLMVLAEAYMADSLYEETHEHDKLLTSPYLAIAKIQEDMNTGSV